ncbi:MAG: NlpC/P60 family protein [Ancrocorticia sp.]|uniref:C40 family peptidase n=1 Tax=Ancrocorticia sp. TaxID=2593684 RepID=UPI003F934CAA
MGNSRIRGSLSFTAALAVVAGAVVAPVSADESDQKALEDSKAAEQSTADNVGSIDVQLAQLAAENNELGNKAADAKAAQLEAEAKLDDALDEAVYANKAADDAAAKVEEAKGELGQISSALYRDGAGAIPGTEFLMGGSSFSDATQKSRAFDLIGQDADQRVQKFEALQDVANSMRDEADAKTEKYQKAAEKAKGAADDAKAAEKESSNQIAAISDQREELITQLAAQKGTTAKIERDIQDKKEAKAKEAAEVQQQETIASAEALFTENDDQVPVADDAAGSDEAVEPANETPAEEQPSEGEPAPAPTSEPAPAPTTPAPSAKPSETSKPSAQPTPSAKPNPPAPQPTPTQAAKPTPSPTQTTKPKPPAPKPKPPAPKPKPKPNPGGSASAIVGTAKAFIGIPYVWGGTSTAGWDCIGFVQYVYAQHGVKIDGYNRTSFTPSVGYEVPYSQAKPGDILFWPGHVAISLGGGQNVGAWNPGMGTRIGPDSWVGTPSKVVRVF